MNDQLWVNNWLGRCAVAFSKKPPLKLSRSSLNNVTETSPKAGSWLQSLSFSNPQDWAGFVLQDLTSEERAYIFLPCLGSVLKEISSSFCNVDLEAIHSLWQPSDYFDDWIRFESWLNSGRINEELDIYDSEELMLFCEVLSFLAVRSKYLVNDSGESALLACRQKAEEILKNRILVLLSE
jgi:hypothetical protein